MMNGGKRTVNGQPRPTSPADVRHQTQARAEDSCGRRCMWRGHTSSDAGDEQLRPTTRVEGHTSSDAGEEWLPPTTHVEGHTSSDAGEERLRLTTHVEGAHVIRCRLHHFHPSIAPSQSSSSSCH